MRDTSSGRNIIFLLHFMLHISASGYLKTAKKEYWFTAGPGCAFPDAALGSFLTSRGSLFKYILVQVLFNSPLPP
jgi:hypothetical protein